MPIPEPTVFSCLGGELWVDFQWLPSSLGEIKRLPASLSENLAVTFKFALYFRTIRIESLNWKLLRSCLLTTEQY